MKKFNELIADFDELCKKISKGKKGIDYMIEDETNGIDNYISTPIEKEFVKLSRNITKQIEENPKFVTTNIYKIITNAINKTSCAQGSFRGRTPAFGGDWQDIDSPVKWEVKNHLEPYLNKYYQKL